MNHRLLGPLWLSCAAPIVGGALAGIVYPILSGGRNAAVEAD